MNANLHSNIISLMTKMYKQMKEVDLKETPTAFRSYMRDSRWLFLFLSPLHLVTGSCPSESKREASCSNIGQRTAFCFGSVPFSAKEIILINMWLPINNLVTEITSVNDSVYF